MSCTENHYVRGIEKNVLAFLSFLVLTEILPKKNEIFTKFSHLYLLLRVIKFSRRRDLYLYNTQHSQQTSMPPVGFEPTISSGGRPHIYALDWVFIGTGVACLQSIK